ncbi:MAG TPA: multifunctional oxoglutarate decarboxylase/oxoglutarate dehydrogenase thiamine pyrophosphate-binding subunit/dihydrolipoyllysine-residue succinyltransferase subunit [Thermoanaerobaculia bacterium]|nr:multifunctional oxoglutarate decarboxylase/oxoglutarate dehydrogenase thiamine pyrophosphate-binding subunit/dihydrolipoyllysine-residue succinyltransferase subunit [Thermoanaerobaculia bacterium]
MSRTETDLTEDLIAEFGENATYVADLLARFRANPEAVDEEWREFFRERLGEPPVAESGRREAAGEAPSSTARARAAAAGGSAPSPARPSAAEPAAAPRELRAGEERDPIRGAALRIAENMEASLQVPTATSQRQVPVKLLDENRRLINGWRADNEQGKISFTHLIAWAVVQALKSFPGLNDAFDASGGAAARIRRKTVNFGLAVDVEKADGSRTLVVPNVKGAEAMNFDQFAASADDVVGRGRRGKLEVRDFEGTTISLTNPGTLGTSASVPRLMSGQGAIIATGAMEYPAEFRALSPEALSQLAVSKVVTFTSTYDHRIVQGAESGSFLALIEELLLGQHGFYEKVFQDLAIPHRPFRWARDKNPAFSGEGLSGEIEKQARVLELINAYRVRGHLIADIDPLRMMALQQHPELDLETYGLTIWDLDRKFWTGGLAGGDHMPLRDIIALMRRVYCGKVGVEYRHISSPAEKYWIRKRVGAEPERLPAALKRRLLERLVAAESFERFLGTRFLGQRRYSIEGSETAIALLDQLVEGAAERGLAEVVLGLTHRGRLNVLANVVGNAAERIFAGFEGTVHPDFPADEGDVKYHQGARSTRRTESGREIAISVPSNPSHLEAVDPVVEGMARAKQDALRLPREESWGRVLPVLLHGDAAFAGQGMVAEVFNLSQLKGYRTGGTVHLIVNNQIGFTTDPAAGRSSLYSTDVAKGMQVPIFHVNGDDPEAAWRVLQIALDYRREFHKDVVIDLIGFRRHGHNEGDEPTYTQPLMYRRIQGHPGVKALYAHRLVREGVLTEEEVAALEKRQHDRYEQALASAQEAAKRSAAAAPVHAGESGRVQSAETAVTRETLAAIGRVLTTVPAGFNLNPKMVQQLARRAKMTEGAQPLDWATAEALAFGSLLLEGTPVRLSGQDSARGTFSQRHVVFHDARTGETWTPLSRLAPEQAPFSVHDSPLSEASVLGFEYGYSVAAPAAVVLWEAQYGDFANGAQVIVDQFVSSALDKWRESSRLVLLLPHGYEGQGPEHSSARIERYLQLCADENWRVCNVTTPAQYFHVLRRQARDPVARPLVLFTPKSLLRFPASFSGLEELAAGGFRSILDDASVADREAVERVILSAGKIFYDLQHARQERKDTKTALVRLEQFYPFDEEGLRSLLAAYPAVAELVWAQEEARNMGGWTFLEDRLRAVLPANVALRYAGRVPSASPATGNANVHKAELVALLTEALGAAPARPS